MIEYPHRHIYYRFLSGRTLHLSERFCDETHDDEGFIEHCVCDECWQYHTDWYAFMEDQS